jgi:hypothetical protein
MTSLVSVLRRHARTHHRRWMSSSIQEIEVVDLSSSTSQEQLTAAIKPYFEKQSPVVLRGAVSKAPAMKLWPSFDYWRDTVGANEVGAIEIGGSYGTADMERVDIPLEGYIQYMELFEERHGRTGPDDPSEIPSSISKEELVYLAQNDLFPSLYKDLVIPDFCQEESHQVGLGHLYSVMLWLGPRGCVSPLHFDPLDNCLMQFVGRKRIWMYPPVQGGWHYAGHDGQQPNTSPVNPEDETTLNQYPLFSQEAPPAIQCVLTPGDLLYIPSKWWHFVRSLDTSASVNVWWR